jgi:hypothetical protein
MKLCFLSALVAAAAWLNCAAASAQTVVLPSPAPIVAPAAVITTYRPAFVSSCAPAIAPPATVIYRPAPVVVPAPLVYGPAPVYVGRPVIVSPKVYVPGQPVRNLLRAVTP